MPVHVAIFPDYNNCVNFTACLLWRFLDEELYLIFYVLTSHLFVFSLIYNLCDCFAADSIAFLMVDLPAFVMVFMSITDFSTLPSGVGTPNFELTS